MSSKDLEASFDKLTVGGGKSRNSEENDYGIYDEASTSSEKPRKSLPPDMRLLREVTPDQQCHSEWLLELERVWFSGGQSSVHIQPLFYDYLQKSSNPYRTALFMMRESSDFFRNKTSSLAFAIMLLFRKWIGKNPNVKQLYLSMDVKEYAFDLSILQKNCGLIELIFKIYCLLEDNTCFIERIRDLLKSKKIKTASQCAALLKLQSHFDIMEIAFPLILEDKLSLLETYLKDCKEQQLSLVIFLDSLCTKKANIYQLTNLAELNSSRRDRFHKKTLKKLASRLMKLYNIPPEKCPNVSNIMTMGALKYLLHKKYIDQKVDDDNWDDLIQKAEELFLKKNAIGNNHKAQMELVQLLISYNDAPCAVKYALLYNLPIERAFPEHLHDYVKCEIDRLTSAKQHGVTTDRPSTSAPMEDWDAEIEEKTQKIHYQLKLPLSAVHIVDTTETVHSCLKTIQNSKIIALDAEWNPTFGLQKERLSLLQISTADEVFLIDVLTLVDVLTENQWNEFFTDLLCTSNIIKLGFGIGTDLKLFSRTIPSFSELMKNVKEILDLSKLFNQLYEKHPSIFFPVTEEKPSGFGLADLIEFCFGLPLDKTEQFGNWERRPLKQSQIIYAALDAYCLLEIYDFLKVRASSLSIDLPTFFKTSQADKAKKKEEKRLKKKKEHQSSPIQIPMQPTSSANAIPPQEFRVVVDTMLQGLGKQLRRCGVDVHILETSEDHDATIKIAKHEDRIILTSGLPYNRLKQFVPEGKCFCVGPGNALEQAEQVLTFYNVQISSNDIFSRCLVCNCNRYIHIPSRDMKEIWQHYKEKNSENSVQTTCNIVKHFDGGSINVGNTTTDLGQPINMDILSEKLIDRVNLFFVCSACGKIYWIGSHYSRTLSCLGKLLKDTDDISET